MNCRTKVRWRDSPEAIWDVVRTYLIDNMCSPNCVTGLKLYDESRKLYDRRAELYDGTRNCMTDDQNYTTEPKLYDEFL